MLENIDLSRKVSKEEFKALNGELELKLGTLQREAKELGIPVIIIFEGWNAAGKGTLINQLILPLDPRGFNVCSTHPPNEEEAMRPFLWRAWTRTPAKGRFGIFDRSWYRRVLTERVDGNVKGSEVKQAYDDICSFERQLAEDGNVIIKFFLHISKSEQKKRFEKLQENPSTIWRVTKDDWKAHKRYDEYLAAVEDVLAETDSEYAPWTVIESHDQRFANLKIFNTVICALESRIADARQEAKPTRAKVPKRKLPEALSACILDKVDLTQTVTKEDYSESLKQKQKRIRELEHEIYVRRIPVIIVYEGWDAAGKGGNIRRLTQNMDPRGYEVVPIGVPNDLEKAHHYLWRFWMQMPKAGHINIFDRSWYGRVLVERVEGFCRTQEWKRAFREINEMEQHLTNFGAVVVKFWLHIDRDEQLRRFNERKEIEYKQWKITDEDWRNREKWEQYKVAVEEMLFRTSTPCAPWTIVESNCKWFARLKALDTVIDAVSAKMRG